MDLGWGLAAANGRLAAELLAQDVQRPAVGEHGIGQSQHLAVEAAVEGLAVFVDVEFVQRLEGELAGLVEDLNCAVELVGVEGGDVEDSIVGKR